MTDTAKLIAEARALLEAATPGPWRVHLDEGRDYDGAPYDIPIVITLPSGASDDDGDLVVGHGCLDGDDAALIARAPALIGELVAALERAGRDIETLEASLRSYRRDAAWSDDD